MLDKLLKDPTVFPKNFGPNADPKLDNANLGTVITGLFTVGLYLAGFLTFFWLVWGAFAYLMARGNKEEIAKARARITWAIIGLIVIILALFIAQFAQQILRPKGGSPII